MEIKPYSILEQVDVAVDLGVLPPGLPAILTLAQFCAAAPQPPPIIIEGLLHQGCKMILGGTSKSNKSWCLLDLALAVASGTTWWGRRCHKMPVLYINFELHAWAAAQRINALCAARPECKGMGPTFHIWNLRGHNTDLALLRPQLEVQLAKHQFGLIILDPAYKVLGDRDENANGEIANLMNELEALAQKTGAAVVVAHHFAKGGLDREESHGPNERRRSVGARPGFHRGFDSARGAGLLHRDHHPAQPAGAPGICAGVGLSADEIGGGIEPRILASPADEKQGVFRPGFCRQSIGGKVAELEANRGPGEGGIGDVGEFHFALFVPTFGCQLDLCVWRAVLGFTPRGYNRMISMNGQTVTSLRYVTVTVTRQAEGKTNLLWGRLASLTAVRLTPFLTR